MIVTIAEYAKKEFAVVCPDFVGKVVKTKHARMLVHIMEFAETEYVNVNSVQKELIAVKHFAQIIAQIMEYVQKTDVFVKRL